MSALQKLKSVVPGVDESNSDTTRYECQECGNVIESAKDPESVRCLDCISDDVEPL
jgi:hypothetical protein